MTAKKIGLVGGRGFVGGELVTLLGKHPDMELAFASSSSKVGEPVPGADQNFISLKPENFGEHADLDALILALPNGMATEWAAAIDATGLDLCILDISADYRFDENWVYGLPEINGKAVRRARRISNPGCYATAAQLALYPFRDLLAGPPSIFGVSGYSGAGATPNPRNDPKHLQDNLLPYALQGHIHEREISHHLGREVHFSPHVTAFFRGISLTIHLHFSEPQTREALQAKLEAFYANAPLVEIVHDIPEVAQTTGTPGARIGGLSVDESGQNAVLVSTLDNLLKGAASQAMQNLELALL
jgi:N-acetyl-gamma-glutamyl-phosphate reductase